MNAIEKVNFKYEYDNGIVLNKKWGKPNINSFLNWWKTFSSFNVHNYEYYLVGGFINKKKTKDIDIVIVGDITTELYSILTLAKVIGFKNNILVDMFWSDVLDPFVNNTYKPLVKVRNFNEIKITKNNKTNTYNYGGKKLLPGLFKNYYKEPDNNILKGKKYKNKYIKIKDFINGTTNRDSIL
jgi:hypothetical protein